MPFCVSPEGRIFIVLGRERNVPGWRGSQRWSAFEGSPHRGEDSETAAAREFTEESLGVFGRRCVDVDSLRASLAKSDYSLKVSINTPVHVHVTYVKQFTWHVGVDQLFSQTRAYVESLERVGATIDELQRCFPRHYPYLREDDVVAVHGTVYTVVEVLAVSVDGDGVLQVRVQLDGGCGAVRRKFLFAGARYSNAYVRWYECRRRVTALLGSSLRQHVPDGALVVQRGSEAREATGQLVRSVKINKDFMEKSCIRLWSVDELRSAVEDTEYVEREFRPFFTIVLKRVLSEFSRVQP